MSGILDNKSRIIDAIITDEGRRQMAAGTFNVSFVTFSDADIAYIPDSDTGHVDPANKIYFEACNLPQDQIVFEANDAGRLVGFRNQDIKINLPSNGNIPAYKAEGMIRDGRLTVYQYYHGRKITTNGINFSPSDAECGFVYSDSSNVVGNILIDPFLESGKIRSNVGPPYKAYIGTKYGLSPQNFATQISGAMELLRAQVSGPKVYTRTFNDSVLLDVDFDFEGSKIYATGSLSTPLILETAALGGSLLNDEISGGEFSSQILGILTSSFDNFSQLQTISTIDRLMEDNDFELSTNELSFDIGAIEDKTLSALRVSAPNFKPPQLNSIDSIFSDDKLSHLTNFMYLPPIVKTSDAEIPDKTKLENLTDRLLGNYPSWGDNEKKLTYEKLSTELSQYERLSQEIPFLKTSLKNNVIGQIFEVTDGVVNKLDIVDFGDIYQNSNNIDIKTKKVFFAGKTFLDDRGTACFINMFTLVFSKSDS